MIGDLESFQTAIADGLRDIEQVNRSIQHNTRRLLNVMGVEA